MKEKFEERKNVKKEKRKKERCVERNVKFRKKKEENYVK